MLPLLAEFLLTRPSRDVTDMAFGETNNYEISTHTSLAGRDRSMVSVFRDSTISTHTSLAGRDEKRNILLEPVPNSTHTSLAGRDEDILTDINYLYISTHTSLAGRDKCDQCGLQRGKYFYSHVPRGT